jgi:hypothetical protein
MADTLATKLIASLEWNRSEALDLSNVIDRAKVEFTQEMADGTGNDQADLIWHDTRTVASAANDDLDLTALTQTIFGSTVTINFAKVKAILIVNTNTVAGDELVVDTSVANAFKGWANGSATSKAEIGPDSAWLVSATLAGWAVTAGTGDIVRISNPGGGTSIIYKIVIIGTSV